MRQLVLDTETTGLSAENGDRIIEIGCVELLDRKLTGNNLHFYINPERDSDEGAGDMPYPPDYPKMPGEPPPSSAG